MRRRVVVGKGSALPGSPFLTHVGLKPDKVQPEVYPFTLPIIGDRFDLKLTTPVTYLVGENAAGLARPQPGWRCADRDRLQGEAFRRIVGGGGTASR